MIIREEKTDWCSVANNIVHDLWEDHFSRVAARNHSLTALDVQYGLDMVGDRFPHFSEALTAAKQEGKGKYLKDWLTYFLLSTAKFMGYEAEDFPEPERINEAHIKRPYYKVGPVNRDKAEQIRSEVYNHFKSDSFQRSTITIQDVAEFILEKYGINDEELAEELMYGLGADEKTYLRRSNVGRYLTVEAVSGWNTPTSKGAQEIIDKMDDFYEDYGECEICGYNLGEVYPITKFCKIEGVSYDKYFAKKYRPDFIICEDCFNEIKPKKYSEDSSGGNNLIGTSFATMCGTAATSYNKTVKSQKTETIPPRFTTVEYIDFDTKAKVEGFLAVTKTALGQKLLQTHCNNAYKSVVGNKKGKEREKLERLVLVVSESVETKNGFYTLFALVLKDGKGNNDSSAKLTKIVKDNNIKTVDKKPEEVKPLDIETLDPKIKSEIIKGDPATKKEKENPNLLTQVSDAVSKGIDDGMNRKVDMNTKIKTVF